MSACLRILVSFLCTGRALAEERLMQHSTESPVRACAKCGSTSCLRFKLVHTPLSVQNTADLVLTLREDAMLEAHDSLTF